MFSDALTLLISVDYNVTLVLKTVEDLDEYMNTGLKKALYLKVKAQGLASAGANNVLPEPLDPTEAKREEMMKWLLTVASSLKTHGVISLPLLRWSGEHYLEQRAMDRVG